MWIGLAWPQRITFPNNHYLVGNFVLNGHLEAFRKKYAATIEIEMEKQTVETRARGRTLPRLEPRPRFFKAKAEYRGRFNTTGLKFMRENYVA